MSNNTFKEEVPPVYSVETTPPGSIRKDSGRFALLRTSSEMYELLVRKIQAKEPGGEPEQVLQMVEQAALCATLSHAGRFADGALENIAWKIGATMDGTAGETAAQTLFLTGCDTRRRVLHVFTQVMGIGGHTRMVHHWVQQDKGSCHSVVLLGQKDTPVPAWLSEAVRESGGTLVVLPSGMGIGRKAQQLRDLARRNADLVVLHHHCWDVVPTVAFAFKDCPPVALLNHADHLFWLGSSVADLVINLRTPGAEHAAERRSVSVNTVLPIPLVDRTVQLSRAKARESLGIPEDQVVILSVGRAEKYRPCGSYDFVATATRILEQLPGAHFYIIGASHAELQPFLRRQTHERLHFMGTIEDPSIYRAAADVYVESFPFGSQTALLEAALCGLPVVPAYAPLFPLLVANDDAVQDLIPNPESEQEYIERVKELVHQPERRVSLGNSLRSRLRTTHVGEGWVENVSALYRETDLLVHNPHPIPSSSCEPTEADVGLSVWHAMSRGSYMEESGREAVSTACWNAASVARQVGNYSVARHFAGRAVRTTPTRLRCWRLLLLAYLGRSPQLMRKAFRKHVGL